MSVSIEDAANCGSRVNNYGVLSFKTQYRDTLGPILYIPSIINGIEYRYIYTQALYNFSKITDVVITEGYLTIYPYAFANCLNLKSIQIPNSIWAIDSNAFLNDAQVILIFTSGDEEKTIEIYTGNNNVKAIICYRTGEIKFSIMKGETLPEIYINSTEKFIFYKCTQSCSISTIPSNKIKPLSEIGDENELINSILKKSSTPNKNKLTYQKSKSQLNLLLITQLILKN